MTWSATGAPDDDGAVVGAAVVDAGGREGGTVATAIAPEQALAQTTTATSATVRATRPRIGTPPSGPNDTATDRLPNFGGHASRASVASSTIPPW
jgi:hypothetical protein